MSTQPQGDLDPEVASNLLVAVNVNAAARQAIVDHLVTQVRAILAGFHDWYDDLAVRRMAKDVAALVSTAQKVAAAREDAFQAHVLRQFSSRVVSPVGPVGLDDLRLDVDAEQVYERLAVQYRYARSTGASADDALAKVLTRAEVMNDTDVSLAVRAQDQKVLQATSLAVGYRRVIHPELSDGGTCGLCIAASDQRYSKEDLLPLHARCKCTVMAIMRGKAGDPGSSLNNLDFATLYADAGSTSAKALKRTRYQIDQHGELGPVLLPKGARVRRAGLKATPAAA